MSALIQYLVSERKRQARTQQDVATAVGVYSQTLCRWERWKATPSLRDFIRWCSALGITIELHTNEGYLAGLIKTRFRT